MKTRLKKSPTLVFLTMVPPRSQQVPLFVILEISPPVNKPDDSEAWVEKENLRAALTKQKKLMEVGSFDPFQYFGWEYMKDYVFYKNNPRLEIAFKTPPLKKKQSNERKKEILVDSNYGLESSQNTNFKMEDSNDLFELSAMTSKVRLIFTLE